MPTIRDLAQPLEAWAPPGSAQDYDNVGLQVGDAHRDVDTALIALDCTPAVLAEAQALGAQLIISHHPLIFRRLSSVTADGFVSNLALRLAEAQVALYSIHTNLDATPGGVSFALAEQLGLRDIDLLDGFDDSLVKLVTFVPQDHFEAVRSAIADAGAGKIGDYDACAFATDGNGYFQPGDAANPHTGTAGGDLQSVSERRIEVQVERWSLRPVLSALKAAHPYEEVAYDVYPIKGKTSQAGLGAIGHLDEAESMDHFLARVKERLNAGNLRWAGDPEGSVQRVAVCGGAGSDFIGTARKAGADAYVTSDITYHQYFNVLDTDGQAQMAVVDAGHYETEAMTEQLLKDYLTERFPDVTFHRTQHRTSPMRTFNGVD
ncbi:Nif3-like dinuclear metal center hexameric protein [Longibacter salinarum]|uniref:GTP cyclohydrolase 1 type 2 homolog n=1 Tax=Longibacter salinarum TaxID=1850348 RepID=A0A2A8CYM1_9BACT|nr:Nif3-like dinuclear metal center hexameric protein [Longibacter salinarum]PEN13746.1 Nif3-like dinuclear metal center hexameric protein [Longibacter salinarum]